MTTIAATDRIAERSANVASRTLRRIGTRVAIVIAIGATSALLAAWLFRSGRSDASDFTQFQIAARMLRDGRDPYAAFADLAAGHAAWPLYYPLPAVLVGWLFSPLTAVTARALFVGLSAAAFAAAAFAAGRPWWLLAFGTPSMFVALQMGQWSPLLSAATVFPWLGMVFACKPTIGLALFAAHPRRSAFVAGAAIVLVSLVVMPAWPFSWWAAIQHAPHVRAPILYAGGPVVLLAALRWRRPDARLLLLLGCVPQTLYAPDTLPLFLVTRTRREAMVLAAGSCASDIIGRILFPAHVTNDPFSELPVTIAQHAPLLILGMYVPALVMILRRPNVNVRPS